MRILIASDFTNQENAGAAGAILGSGRALAARGHSIDYLWKLNQPYRLSNPSLYRWLELPRRQYLQIAARMNQSPFDAVLISQPFAYLAYERLPAKFPRTLFLNVTHGWEVLFNAARMEFAWDGPYSPLRRLGLGVTQALVNQACRRTVRACHGVITASQHDARYIRRAYQVPETSVTAIAHGLDDSFLRAEPARGERSSMVRMLYVGNYFPRKGSEVLEAVLPPLAQAYPHASMTFVVEPHMVERVRACFAPAFGDRLTVSPWRNRTELPAVYAQHDILLFPSLYEGFGLTFLEAMGCGACVVGFKVGGLPDVAANGMEALYCDVGAVEELGQLIGSCLANPGATRTIGQRGQHVARRYSWALAAEKIETFCDTRRETLALCDGPTPGAVETRTKDVARYNNDRVIN